MQVDITVNGVSSTDEVRPGTTLLTYLRTSLGLTGTKESCGRGECGACTVIMGDRAVMSCVQLAVETREPVTTVEGLKDAALDLREAFADQYGFQCGYCTPGQIVRAEALLRARSEPITRDEIQAAMGGNICRCTGYAQIVDAVASAAQKRGLLDEGATP